MPAAPWEWHNPIDQQTIRRTDKFRTRLQRFTGRLVLQVEFTGIRRPLFGDGQTQSGTATWWQDATPDDASALGISFDTKGYGSTPPNTVPA